MLFFFTRWLGKKQLAEMNIFEYTSGIVLGSIAAIFSFDVRLNITYGLLTMFIWFIIPYSVEYFSLKSKTFRHYINGKTTVLIKHGKVLEKSLRKETLTADELLANLRTKNVFRVADVEFAAIEPSGKLSVLPKRKYRPLTPIDMNLEVREEREADTLIIDGQIVHKTLSARNISERWLLNELAKKRLEPSDVFLGQIDTDDHLYLDVFHDKLASPEENEKNTLKKVLAYLVSDLEKFSERSDVKKDRVFFNELYEQLKSIEKKLKPYID